ncbi:D-3-phosphoglycerate dehydrogenase [Magnetococcus marinus MC-1]|uniref:D-3-phosphoglycerate dehydrogenase n=1 Tax=Magnetococcus marinus (strain ATCC BAA-1437 / JCM 17883 / MC-1) TaxID=156889 RepID=A0L7J1_MAGMM|nr:phosphoglycerate dehydrogenase [Magnetococcus marinus]ABK43934.1 D-3-phosphoglycerate dehydrogenase [Magnetococcus marinus MC-1]
MAKVLIADKMSPMAEEVFRARGLEVDVKVGMSPDELLACIDQYDGIAIRSATRLPAQAIAAASRLKVIGRAGIGVDNVDTPAASQKGIIVMNTPFGNAITTAELGVTLAMAAARHIPAATASTKAGKWEKSRFMGRELAGKTAGVIGLGNVGRLVAQRLAGLDMKVVAYDPFINKDRAISLGLEMVDKLEDLWPRVDLLTVHTPLNDHTRNLVDAKVVAQMKEGVILVNCARGGIYNEDALYDGLVSGKIYAAGLDVYVQEPAYSHKLFELDNVVATPHLGGSTKEAQTRVAIQIAEQISDYLVSGVVKNALNIPSVTEAELPTLRPYLALVEKLGTTLGQIVETGVLKLEVIYQGEVARIKRAPITTALLKSFLSPMMDGVVNMVNANLVAEQRGIQVVESSTSGTGSFTSLVRVVVTTERRSRCVTGTLFNGTEPRLISMDEIPIEAQPEGLLLFVANDDTPGLIGRVGTLLGEAGVNISSFHLGREQAGGRAIAFINVDSEVPAPLMQQLHETANVREVKLIRY